MQIILLHPRLTLARSLTLQPRHLVLLALALVVAIVSLAMLLVLLALRHADLLPPALAPSTGRDSAREERYIKENIAAMAVRVGEMQAQLMRLDAPGQRVQGLSGVPPEAFRFGELPGRGGPENRADSTAAIAASRGMAMAEFQRLLAEMAQAVAYRADYLNVVESALMNETMQFRQLPTIPPVNVSYNASGFGWRVDPFSGRSSFHEGIDFPGPTGTPIVAAAGGVVVAALYHAQFGNMLDLDHGNGIVTRYAHASRRLVQLGDIVRRGQHVADIGTSGRSTGAHLHFEVLVKGIHQDPDKFLLAGAANGASGLAKQAAKPLRRP